jgi:hypothetical protein
VVVVVVVYYIRTSDRTEFITMAGHDIIVVVRYIMSIIISCIIIASS